MVPNLTSTLEPEMAAGPSRTPAFSSRYIRFGPFQVDQHRQEVSKDGARLKLQGKVYQVLVTLIEKQGEVVTREELRVRLWPADTHVNYDANVNTTVNKLRLALGDSSEKPLYIETIPRRGYCLIVRPEFVDVPVTAVPVSSSSNPVSSKPEDRYMGHAGHHRADSGRHAAGRGNHEALDFALRANAGRLLVLARLLARIAPKIASR
jgi:DNA-binding winged helix-turn-helix (wHTH) protein